ncbi:MAG: hypothetical protein K2X04_02035 [Burkholderiales bacterium]|nr:hypothetical protein [Burkholderiales bacterium]
MKYKFAAIFVLISGMVFATNNNDLFLTSGDNCAEIEKSIFTDKFTYDQFIYQHILDCLNGATYSYNNHGFKNLFKSTNEEPDAPTLEKDGERYQLQYFSSVESMNQRIEVINYKNQLYTYNNCNSSNTEQSKAFSLAQTEYTSANSNYQIQLKAYNIRNSDYQSKFKAAKKVQSQLVKYAYDLCMNGGLVNGYGVSVPKIGCEAYAQAYVMSDLAPEYNYRHNNMLNILSKSPGTPPVAPDKPQAPTLQSCGRPPIQPNNTTELNKNTSSPVLDKINKQINITDN